jgi:uncharacterized protein YjiS (DUF1127 family)
MLPGSLNMGRSALLSSSAAKRRDVPARRLYSVTMLFATVQRVLHVLSAWEKRAAGRRELSMLDDHVLRDIGLTRADVGRELMKPIWRA